MKQKNFRLILISAAVICIMLCSAFYVMWFHNKLFKTTPAVVQNETPKSITNENYPKPSIDINTEETPPASPTPNTQTKTIINDLCVINNFGEDPETQRNFTWYAPPSIVTGAIDYCAKDRFNGFDKSNIIRVHAKSYETKTDLDTRIIYKAQLNNLTPGTEYVYRTEYGPDSVSTQGTFITAGQNPGKFTFINITDTQGDSAKDYFKWKNTLDKALEKFPDAKFLVHTGDMVDDRQKINQWSLFKNAVKDELMNLPIVPTVGNHEALNKNNTNTDMKNFTDTFDLPDEKNTGAPTGTVYSFDYGNVHVAVMNTQCNSKNLAKQADWLAQDMAKSNKTWKIVALHRGPYGATYDTTDIRDAWAPVFDKLGIDLVLQGHDHNYMRSYPIKNKARSENGTVYMDSNSGGVKFYPQKSRWWQAMDFQPNTQMYIAITVDNNKLEINAYDFKNNLRDSVTLKK